MEKLKNCEKTHCYMRREAIGDGVLINARQLAEDTGVRVALSITDRVWEACIKADSVEHAKRRVRSMLNRLQNAVETGDGQNPILFTVYLENEPARVSTLNLKAICGQGERGAPVLKIMLVDEF